MNKKMSDIEKSKLILEKSAQEFSKLSKQVREMNNQMYNLEAVFKATNEMMKRYLNEEKNQGNVHKDCEWYNEEKDYCSNYMMGVYTGLAFEVSRHNKCIKELIKDDKK